MNKSIESSGRTVEDAVNKALTELGASIDDVVIDVLDEGEPGGLLGIGSKPARVVVTIDDGNDEAGEDSFDPVYYGDDEEAESVVGGNELGDAAIAFLKEVLDAMDVPATYSYTFDEDHLFIDVDGDDVGAVIGRRGETLNALQYLTSLLVNRQTDKHIYVTVDVAGYRERREKSLESLARRTAAKVVEVGKEYEMEPMNAAERRIIHATLQGFEGIRTESEGQEPNRSVIIIPLSLHGGSEDDDYAGDEDQFAENDGNFADQD